MKIMCLGMEEPGIGMKGANAQRHLMTHSTEPRGLPSNGILIEEYLNYLYFI